ncbi:MAG: OB-fold domain-containing protein [Pseudomonadota bacterium]
MLMVSDDLVAETNDGFALIGGKSKSSEKYAFPMPTGADADYYDAVPLKRQGTLWSYTVQRFPPKTPYIGAQDPATFKPYIVGYIELREQVIVEGYIVNADLDQLHIGAELQVTVTAFTKNEDGEPVHIYAFEPVPKEVS